MKRGRVSIRSIWRAGGATVVYLSSGTTVLGMLALADTPRAVIVAEAVRLAAGYPNQPTARAGIAAVA